MDCGDACVKAVDTTGRAWVIELNPFQVQKSYRGGRLEILFLSAQKLLHCVIFVIGRGITRVMLLCSCLTMYRMYTCRRVQTVPCSAGRARVHALTQLGESAVAGCVQAKCSEPFEIQLCSCVGEQLRNGPYEFRVQMTKYRFVSSMLWCAYVWIVARPFILLQGRAVTFSREKARFVWRLFVAQRLSFFSGFMPSD